MKNTHDKTQKTSTAKPEAATGPEGTSIAPPAYGIDHLDLAAPVASHPLQLKADLSAGGASGASSPNNTGLPDALKTGVEALSGFSLDDVRVHYNSSKPAELQALAYAQGTYIHIAPGQERHLPHEAWHVVQQKQGRVKPTLQMKGISVNDENGLEHEADAMGAKALSHAGDRLPLNLVPKTSESIAENNATQPVQRYVGFEVEYQVPTFGPAVETVTIQDGKNPADNQLKHFLFAGLPYGTELGGSAKLGDNSFRLTTDHNSAISREPIRAKLASMGKLDPADTVDRDASSNLEYVTSPVDELAKGSDKVFNTLIDEVANHAASTFAVANGKKMGKIPAPATNVATGTPIDKFQQWLSDDDLEQVKPTITSYWKNILDSCYIQATIGVIPGGVSTLMQKAKDTSGLHYTGGQFDQIYAAIDTSFLAVSTAVANHEYIKSLDPFSEETLHAVNGIIRLLLMYLIGEALSQTDAFPGGTIKNAVPFLIKIDPAKIIGAGPAGMAIFDAVPDDFVTTLAGEISGREEITVKYWRDLGYGARVRGSTDQVTVGSVENLAKMFLQGKKPASTGAQTGSQLKNLDPITPLSGELFPQNEGQKGIPLEYRYVKARPNAIGLKAELLKIVREARDINLSRSSSTEKSKIEKQVKE